jgi:hypothetical protein
MNFMSSFMDNYEDVQSRVRRWQVAFPVGRIETEVVWHDFVKGQVLVVAKCFREYEDQNPSGVDWAYGDIATYPQSMRKFFLEDTVTSAIGRCLSLVLETATKATAQDMAKVKVNEPKPYLEKLADKIIMPLEDDPWSIKAVEPAPSAADAVALVQEVLGAIKIDKDIPHCKHGERVWKTGNKNGRAWANMGCSGRPRVHETWADFDKCDPIWYVINSDGSWKPQDVQQ